jgi:hypothetical protein
VLTADNLERKINKIKERGKEMISCKRVPKPNASYDRMYTRREGESGKERGELLLVKSERE